MLRIRLIEELEVPYRNRFEQLQQIQDYETGVTQESIQALRVPKFPHFRA